MILFFCRPISKFWENKGPEPAYCLDENAFLIANEVVNSCLDFALTALSIAIVQTRLQKESWVKTKLCLIFMVGGLSGVIGFVKIGILHQDVSANGRKWCHVLFYTNHLRCVLMKAIAQKRTTSMGSGTFCRWQPVSSVPVRRWPTKCFPWLVYGPIYNQLSHRIRARTETRTEYRVPGIHQVIATFQCFLSKGHGSGWALMQGTLRRMTDNHCKSCKFAGAST